MGDLTLAEFSKIAVVVTAEAVRGKSGRASRGPRHLRIAGHGPDNGNEAMMAALGRAYDNLKPTRLRRLAMAELTGFELAASRCEDLAERADWMLRHREDLLRNALDPDRPDGSAPVEPGRSDLDFRMTEPIRLPNGEWVTFCQVGGTDTAGYHEHLSRRAALMAAFERAKAIDGTRHMVSLMRRATAAVAGASLVDFSLVNHAEPASRQLEDGELDVFGGLEDEREAHRER